MRSAGSWLLLLLTFAPPPAAQSQAPDFGSFSQMAAGQALPSGWKRLSFEAIPRATRYALARDGDKLAIRADADASASALVHRFAQPTGAAVLRWRWKVDMLPSGADTRRKHLDDAATRVYVTFGMPPENLSRMERLKYGALRAFYGEDPPEATIVYVWDNEAAVGTRAISPYTDRARIIVVESGASRIGQWLEYERNVLADFRLLFGRDAPPVTGIGLMTDTDNTESRALAWYGDITLRPR